MVLRKVLVTVRIHDGMSRVPVSQTLAIILPIGVIVCTAVSVEVTGLMDNS